MSIAICSSEMMISGPRGTGFAEAWMPRIVAERFTTSTKDGNVQRAPDPVIFIDAEMNWTNSTGSDQQCWLSTHRAPRTVIGTNPNTYALDDAVSFDIAVSPNAPEPYATEDGIGCRASITPFALNQINYGRFFRGWDDNVRFQSLGVVPAGQTAHIRYRALYTTPGQWREPNQAFQVVRAYWVRLLLWAAPE